MKQKHTHSPYIHTLPSATQLRDLFARQQKPLRLDALLRIIGLARSSKKTLVSLLQQLEEQGLLLRLHGGAWIETSKLQTITGYYSVTRSGVGFVSPQETNEHGRKILNKDIFIHPTKNLGAWHGDMVRVQLVPGTSKGKNPEGHIIELIEHGQHDMAVRVAKLQKGIALCHPVDPRFNITFKVAINPCPTRLQSGDLILIKPTAEISKDLWQADIISAFGNADDVRVQEQLVKLNHQITSDFPLPVLKEANSLNSINADIHKRVDVRAIPFVTIDGHSAKDFDDAIHVSSTAEGGWLLQVGIADVTHYVRPGSALDKEAQARGNSYYFPTSVEPMLPEVLSNGLCSLNPNEDRLIILAELTFSAQGQNLKSHFSSAIMRSAARLTYDQVKNVLNDKEDNKEKQALLALSHGAEILVMLQKACQLAEKLHAIRYARNSLDFDLPEPEYVFDERGHVCNIRHKERHFAHRLIEECMIATNEAVARFLKEKALPCLYRVHPEPEEDRLHSLFDTLKSTTLAKALPPVLNAHTLQTILHVAQESTQEYMINHLVLRTMPQARYQPANEGHFGLGSSCYCHFTSPIRRYADIIVHRALKHALSINGGMLVAEHKLLRIGDQLNRRERAAIEAEREINRRLACLTLHGREGEEFEGIICSVNDFGIFVELHTMPIEGMIKIANLGDDYYEYDPQRQELLGVATGRHFCLGQNIRVRLEEVNKHRLEIQFALPGSRQRNKTTHTAGTKSKGLTKNKKIKRYFGKNICGAILICSFAYLQIFC